jgi:hypothetical protein
MTRRRDCGGRGDVRPGPAFEIVVAAARPRTEHSTTGAIAACHNAPHGGFTANIARHVNETSHTLRTSGKPTVAPLPRTQDKRRPEPKGRTRTLRTGLASCGIARASTAKLSKLPRIQPRR